MEKTIPKWDGLEVRKSTVRAMIEHDDEREEQQV